MKHKITIKDVAREAGVSIATVSYVLNNRTDKRISDKTRKKVLQVINLLNYTPNQSAQALATSRNHRIALYLLHDLSVYKSAEQMHFLHTFSSFLQKRDYDLICLSDTYLEQFDHADAIVCYDVSSGFFRQIGDTNFIPLVALDCRINDPLFFQVNTDYESLAKSASAHFQGEDYTLAVLDTPNEERKSILCDTFPHVTFIRDMEDLHFSSDINLTLIDDTLLQLLKNRPNKIYYHPAISEEKLEQLFLCIEYALQRTPIEQHDVLV